jgi:cell wall-associated NlpC family hydrolase
MQSISKYLKIPYLYNGRDFSGCDCYGLVILYFKNELGIDLIDYKNPTKHWNEIDNTDIFSSKAENEFIENNIFAKNNVMLLLNGNTKTPNHVGIILNKDRFLHIVETGCHITRIKRWKDKIYKVYRHRSLI